MKLKKLTIHNLASIEDAVIDFENGPLADDSRFLICGPTGAGKTTLLDAICLVLYGTTPRLRGAANESYVDSNENFTLKSRDDIKIDDTRMLMRRGSLEAAVELLFTDKDDAVLKARWECSRVRNKPEGNIKEPEWTLSEEDDTLISSKKTEVLGLIAERIGLTFEQFCRTTMLAQGDFTKFLKSSEGEKSEILEKLTGTGIYSVISRQIYAVSAEKRNVCKAIESQLGGVQLLTDEQRGEIVQQQKALQSELKQLNREEQQLSQIIQWMTRHEQLKQSLEEATKAYDKQQLLMESESYRRNSAVIADWDGTVQQRERWKEKTEAVRLLMEQQEKEVQLLGRYRQLSGGLATLRQTVTEQEGRRKKIQQYLSDEQPKEPCYLNISLIAEQARQQAALVSQLAESRKVIADRQREIEACGAALTGQQALVESEKKKVAVWQQALDEAVRQLEGLRYNELLERQRDLNRQQADLKDFRHLTERCEQLHGTTMEKQQALHKVEQLVEELTRKVATAEQEVKAFEQQVRDEQQVYEKQQLACNDLMKEYRSRLSVGDTCPLCGQPITALTSDEHFVSILQPVKERLEQLQEQQRKAGVQLAEQKAALAANRNEVVRLTNEQKGAEEQEQAAVEKRNAHGLLSRFEAVESPLTVIDEALNNVQQQLSDLGERLKEVGVQQLKVNELQQQKTSEDEALRKAENEVSATEQRQVKTMESLRAEEAASERNTKQLEETEKRLFSFVDEARFRAEGVTYITALQQGASRYQSATNQLQQVNLELQQLNTEMQGVVQSKHEVEVLQPAWSSAPDPATMAEPSAVASEELPKGWADLRTAVSLCKEVCDKALQRKEQAEEALKVYFARPEAVSEGRLSELVAYPTEMIESARRRLQAMRDELTRFKAQQETADKLLQQQLEQRPAMEEQPAADYLRSQQAKKEAIDAANRQLGQYAQRLEEDRKNQIRFEKIRAELLEAQQVADRWERFSQLFGSADGKKFRNIAQSYVLEQLLVSSNQYLEQFTRRYEMVCQPGSLTILLRDMEAGGVLRPTSTISGGESFLISLSLALGLSSLSRASVSMDTLFIDEGFGTLDSTYLSAVMDALERLHQMNGKRIGIISHVESLKERLTTQIRVSRVNNTLSQVEVVSLI